jgi:hypothetical protein
MVDFFLKERIIHTLDKQTGIQNMARTRKARSDRNHCIYVLTNTVTGEQYVGLTVAVGSVAKSLKVRVQKHCRRALTENKNWTLCNAIRAYGPESFTYGLLEIVRGKLNAHRREQEIIREHAPALNVAVYSK